MERLYYKHKFGYLLFKFKLNSFKKEFNLHNISKKYMSNDDFIAKIEGSIIIIFIKEAQNYEKVKSSLNNYFNIYYY